MSKIDNPTDPIGLANPAKTIAPITPLQLVLKFEKDFKIVLIDEPVSHLQDASLTEFFALCGKISGSAVLNLEISFVFTSIHVQRIDRETSEDSWAKFKDHIAMLYTFTRKRHPKHTDFAIWVEIRNVAV
jgi:hypothetical protein